MKRMILKLKVLQSHLDCDIEFQTIRRESKNNIIDETGEEIDTIYQVEKNIYQKCVKFFFKD